MKFGMTFCMRGTRQLYPNSTIQRNPIFLGVHLLTWSPFFFHQSSKSRRYPSYYGLEMCWGPHPLHRADHTVAGEKNLEKEPCHSESPLMFPRRCPLLHLTPTYFVVPRPLNHELHGIAACLLNFWFLPTRPPKEQSLERVFGLPPLYTGRALSLPSPTQPKTEGLPDGNRNSHGLLSKMIFASL